MSVSVDAAQEPQRSPLALPVLCPPHFQNLIKATERQITGVKKKKEKKNTHTLTHIPSCTRCWPSYCKPPMVFKTPIPPSTQSNNHIALDLDAKRILANEFYSPHPVRLLFVDLRQRESYRNNSVKTNRRTWSHIYRAFPQSNATPRHVQYAKMRVLRLGDNCTRQNGAVRLSPARIKATNMFSLLFHQEASPCCVPVCVRVC